MKRPTPDFHDILETLTAANVDFIIVGGVCAVLHGAPISTFDLDLVHARSPENLDRLLAALGALESYSREKGDPRAKPSRAHLASAGHQLLMTRSGPLDLLGEVGTGRGYEDLLPNSEKMRLGDALEVRVLNLETLIEIKQQLGRDKDRAVLAILRRTLEEKSRRQGG